MKISWPRWSATSRGDRMAIIQTILPGAGPARLAGCATSTASGRGEIARGPARALGSEHLFPCGRRWRCTSFYGQQLKECDAQLKASGAFRDARRAGRGRRGRGPSRNGRRPAFDVGGALHRLAGDLPSWRGSTSHGAGVPGEVGRREPVPDG